MDKILIIGAGGQLGTELAEKLRAQRGIENVITSDLSPAEQTQTDGVYEQLNILDKNRFQEIIQKHNITIIYHLAAILSAKGEENPLFAWQLNMDSLLTVLEAGKSQLKKIYWPSSIAVFGKDSPRVNTPQTCIMNPDTVYGISKLAGERWCEYYHNKYQVDVRSLRYPGLIGHKAMPGGGTTDYAVDIFHKAAKNEPFQCFLSEGTMLPMMYMDDAVNATIQLMDANAEDVKIRSSYNIAAMSFSPRMISEEIQKYRPNFQISYKPDFRQVIADSWSDSLDDQVAKTDWNWENKYDLPKMTKLMLEKLDEKYKVSI